MRNTRILLNGYVFGAMKDIEVLAAKPVPEQLFPALISCGVSGNRTRVSAVR